MFYTSYIMAITNSKEQFEDKKLDITLRPQSFNDYIGQEKTKRNLKILIEAAQKRKESIEHVLLYGPAGLGKTTLSHIIAKELGVGIKITSGPAIERVGDLGSILTNLQDGDILFIDEIHRLNKLIEEVLYPAMEDYKLDIIVGKGPSARTLQLDLPKFTLIGATTRLGSISNPLRNRFGAIHRLEFYSPEEIKKIIKRSSTILGIPINEKGSEIIASCSRQTPRIANRILKRVRDLAQIQDKEIICDSVAKETLQMLEVDHVGLEPTDRIIMKTIIEKFDGGPVGIGTIAAATSEEIQTIEDVYEPYLIQLGFLVRTPRGRMITERGLHHLGYAPKKIDL
ncbi:MAG: Holliday junction ATP-dependent DNA helicase RuvB [Candidatus Moranbacteria bacterium GW2011_GWE2_35_2-]|nr:MAG: Holliday junction ATP-dependent DNA helicase RuvB [Candidatus Moranbacteria bacterium GW2011_GWE2_35_2-]KKQ22645.1 MAG: Holliday junction ATP-dependent DNA helicase RuvB [Candidatus Moranbacteria bacterium GW2011_GWF2_37_11]KKQ29047.1 MAG: Holliday junction ATP-dependent DNA helicase RuvB [Candidatus Moranbacteria bacterium GW2011_GWD1_37_17]KKQ30417.1 MAG: Holliday junction ATP-dependent DNA helicase RuvB [Candidatus Moranbacteria bacterium GW2011_GWE1_37_24]KKQ47897.1 MAG: Holliday ju